MMEKAILLFLSQTFTSLDSKVDSWMVYASTILPDTVNILCSCKSSMKSGSKFEQRRQDKKKPNVIAWTYTKCCHSVRCGKQIRLQHFCKVNHMWTMMSEIFFFFAFFTHVNVVIPMNNTIMKQWFYVL